MKDRPLYMISVVSQMLSMHPQTIRQYEKIGLLKPSRTDGNTRLYSDDDIQRLQNISVLTKDKKVNIAGVEIILALSEEIQKLKENLDTMQVKLNDRKTGGQVIKIKIDKDRGEK